MGLEEGNALPLSQSQYRLGGQSSTEGSLYQPTSGLRNGSDVIVVCKTLDLIANQECWLSPNKALLTPRPAASSLFAYIVDLRTMKNLINGKSFTWSELQQGVIGIDLESSDDEEDIDKPKEDEVDEDEAMAIRMDQIEDDTFKTVLCK